ncbi:hypothetical protein L202_05843 [Cryptococcus amylolentus CBS 6039]|uniref:Uncharacterized protein n=1 Tax=Cryptococcus amylolentus CBS 6039 TaxID=1295533 RepID=A0A1E3HK74_9TREE|nr:hypothetical protein L202_05843 [Cryptococcus amylolentus CBS 6039]ODN75851.1 hypothetical protein L202_05843 [Cryptococcus amylolentus CBS 6039]
MTSKAFMIGTSLLIGALTTAIGFYLYSHAQEPISPPSALDIDFEGDLPPTGTSLRVGSGSVLPQIVTAPTPEPDRSRGASNAGSDPAPGGAHPTVFASKPANAQDAYDYLTGKDSPFLNKRADGRVVDML